MRTKKDKKLKKGSSTWKRVSRALMRLGLDSLEVFVTTVTGNEYTASTHDVATIAKYNYLSKAVVNAEPAFKDLPEPLKDRIAGSLTISLIQRRGTEEGTERLARVAATATTQIRAERRSKEHIIRGLTSIVGAELSRSMSKSRAKRVVAKVGYDAATAPILDRLLSGATEELSRDVFDISLEAALNSTGKMVKSAAANKLGKTAERYVEGKIPEEHAGPWPRATGKAVKGMVAGFGIGGVWEGVQSELVAQKFKVRPIGQMARTYGKAGLRSFSPKAGLKSGLSGAFKGAGLEVAEYYLGLPPLTGEVVLMGHSAVKNPAVRAYTKVGISGALRGAGSVASYASKIGGVSPTLSSVAGSLRAGSIAFASEAVAGGASASAASAAAGTSVAGSSAAAASSGAAFGSTATIAGISVGTITVVGLVAVAAAGIAYLSYNLLSKEEQKEASKKRRDVMRKINPVRKLKGKVPGIFKQQESGVYKAAGVQAGLISDSPSTVIGRL